MKSFFFTALVLCLGIVFSFDLRASEGTGCLFNNSLYIKPMGSSGGFPQYNSGNGNSIPYSSVYCPVPVGTCRIKGDNNDYIEYTYKTTAAECPLDSNVFVLLAMAGVGGYYYVQKHRSAPLRSL